MSRFADDYYEEGFNNQGELFWANCDRALKGRKGQAALVELREALVAMPVKAIIQGRLADEQGNVCAVGALAVARRVKAGEDRASVLEELARIIPEDENCDGATETANVGVSLGFTFSLAYRLAYTNDEELGWEATPEERYEQLLAWIDRKLRRLSPA